MTGAQMELLDAVDAICRRWPASVTSWWRSARHNASTPGSVPNSQHVNGLAVDLVFDGPQPSKAELAGFLSPTMQDVRSEPGHVHLEQDPRLLARRVATAPAGATRSPSSQVPVQAAPPYSSSSRSFASTAVRTVDATSGRAGPGSSPIDALFKGRG